MVREVFIEDNEMIIKKSVFREMKFQASQYKELMKSKIFRYEDLITMYNCGKNDTDIDFALKQIENKNG